MVSGHNNLRRLEQIITEETYQFNKNLIFCDNWWDMFDMGNGGKCNFEKIAGEFGPNPAQMCYLLYPTTIPLEQYGREGSDMVYFTFGREKIGLDGFRELGWAIINSYRDNLRSKTNMLGISFLKNPRFKSFYVELNLFVPCSRDGIIFRLDRDNKEGIVFRSIEANDGLLSMYYHINNDANSFGVEISEEEKFSIIRQKYLAVTRSWAQQFGYTAEKGRFVRSALA